MLRKTAFVLMLLGYSCLTTAQTTLQPVTNGKSLTVCEALESALQYSGKLVEVRGRWGSVAGGRLGDDCAPNALFGQAWLTEILLEHPRDARDLPSPITWTPIDPGAFYFSFKGARAELDRHIGVSTRKGNILVTVVGRFESRAAINGAGYGEQGAWPARIIISSIKDITLVVDEKIVFP